MPISSYIKITTVFTSLLVSASVWAAGTSFLFDGDVTAAFDNNVTRALVDSDIRQDSFIGAGFNLRLAQDISDTSGLLYSIKTATKAFSEFSGLNEFTVAGEMKYSYRPGNHFTSSIYSISGFAKERFSNSTIRDSTTLGATLQMMKPLTDAMTMVVGIGYTDEEAEGLVFDLQRARLFANLDFRVRQNLTIFTTYVFVDGGVVSSGEANIFIHEIAEDNEHDDAFGGEGTGEFFAYRVDAFSHLLTLGANWQLAHHSSLDFSARYLNSTSKKDSSFKYDDMLVRAAYLFAF